MDAESLADRVMTWVQSASEQRMKRYERKAVRKVVWWTDELDRIKRVRKSRRAYQCARKTNRENMNKR